MVSPPPKKSAAASPPFTSNSYLLLAVKILLAIIIILLLPKLVTGASNDNNNNRSAGGRKKNKLLLQKLQEVTLDCSLTTACNEFVPEEGIMCVSRCISQACHDRIYAPNPLEDGEMDVSRAKEFESCFREEVRLKRRRERSQRTK
jgi:hypothetical protein